jgi:hypothetical protein
MVGIARCSNHARIATLPPTTPLGLSSTPPAPLVSRLQDASRGGRRSGLPFFASGWREVQELVAEDCCAT